MKSASKMAIYSSGCVPALPAGRQLCTHAVRATHSLDVKMFLLVFFDQLVDFGHGVIGGVVQQQDVYLVNAVGFGHLGAGLHQPADDVFFVINRQVDGNGRTGACRIGERFWSTGNRYMRALNNK